MRRRGLGVFLLAAGFFILSSLSVQAADIQTTLAWDPNQESDMDYYTVYQAELLGDTSTDFFPVGTVSHPTTQMEITIDDAKIWVWQVTATDVSGNESRGSSIVISRDKIPPGHVKNPHRP